MDEAFSLVAARMPPTRRLSPFGVRMVAMLIVVALLIAGFGAFVVGQQRAADRRRAALVTSQAAAQDARARALAAGGIRSEVASTGAVAALLDGQARDAATAALAVAAEVASSSSYDAARPAALAAHDQQLLYVDGPSTAPSVVSVYNGAGGVGCGGARVGRYLLLGRSDARWSHPIRLRGRVHGDGGAGGRPPRLVAASTGFARRPGRYYARASPLSRLLKEGWP